MDNAGQITEDMKNDLYRKIIDVMLKSLDVGSISSEESEEISMFVLNNIDSAPNELYIESFLEELSKRWPQFSPLLQPYRQKEIEATDQQEIQNVTNELKNLTQ